MCGIGKRFKVAGYKSHKSMIQINDKNMIERVIDNFKEITVFIIISKSVFQMICKDNYWENIIFRVNLIFVKEHQLGPAYSIFKAFDQIPKGVPTYISYCDITWNWLESFEPSTKETQAAIFCHYGFHPHLVNNNFSAFCKSAKNDKYILEEIKEKESFTNEWMNEALSIGLFFINNIELIKLPLIEMIKIKDKISEEYFPSLLFNYLVRDLVKVELIKVDSFVHYGTPSQLNDLNSWIKYTKRRLKNINESLHINKYSAIILTSGKGSRMKTISDKPKAEIDVMGERMIDLVYKSLPINENQISVIQSDSNKPISLLPSSTIYFQIEDTKSQLDSLKLSSGLIKKSNNFFLCSCDCFGFFDQLLLRKMIKSGIYDAICFGFDPSLLQLKLKSSFSTYTVSSQNIKKVYVKSIPEEFYYGLAGFFWFKDGRVITKILRDEEFINIKDREIIVDDVIESLREKKYSIGHIPLTKYIHLGTPEEFKEYIYWNSHIPGLLKNL